MWKDKISQVFLNEIKGKGEQNLSTIVTLKPGEKQSLMSIKNQSDIKVYTQAMSYKGYGHKNKCPLHLHKEPEYPGQL